MNSMPARGVVEVREPRFKLIPFDAITVGSELAYLIKGIIPRSGLIVVWGPPKCGKSFWVYDLTMHVALNWLYRGRKVVCGPVVYCALEGQSGYGQRVEAFRQKFLPDDTDAVPFFLVAARLSLVKEHEELIAAIRLQIGAIRPVAVVLDTLNRSLDGSESDDRDMSAYVRAGDAIREAFGCAVIIVHHCGVEGTRPRGHTSLTGAVDAQLAVKRDGAGNVVVTVEWMKDGPEGDIIVSRLEPVDVGLDLDGDPITSCVVVPVEGAPTRAAPNRKLSARQRCGLDALNNRAAACGKAPPAEFGLSAGLVGISVDEWRDELLRAGVIPPDSSNPRQDFKRIKEDLQARKLIGLRDNWVWSAAS